MSNHDQTARGEFSPLWSVPASVNNKPIITNNVLYFVSSNKAVALNASTGAEIWQSSDILFGFIVDHNQGSIYGYGYAANVQQRAILALKMSDGSLLWTSPNTSNLPRMVSNGVVYLAESSGNCNQANASDVYALQASNGHSLWHVHL